MVTGGVAHSSKREDVVAIKFGALLAYVHTWVSGSKGLGLVWLLRLSLLLCFVLAVLQQCLIGECLPRTPRLFVCWFLSQVCDPLAGRWQ